MARKNTIKKSALTPTVLVAGGAGFIGSRLSEILLEKGARVIVLDNFITGKKNQVEHLLENPNFALFDADINNGIPPEIESADYVFHLAALENYKGPEKNADLESLLTNAIGTKNLLDFAKKSGGKFLLVSSINVYQGQLSPLDLSKYFGHTEEEENKFELAEARRFAEAMVWEFFKNYDSDVRIVRLPEIYGPRMDEDSGGDLGGLIQELISRHVLTIRGEGLNKEYYLYIEDAVNGLVKALFNPHTKGKIFTLVEKEPYTPLEIAYLLKNLANQPTDVKFSKSSIVPNRNLVAPDTSNHPVLKWSARTGFKEGVEKTLKSMGYEINKGSFKPGKLIDKKADEIENEKKVEELGSIMTLQDLKPKEKEEPKAKKNKKPFSLKKSMGSIFRSGETSNKKYVKREEQQPKTHPDTKTAAPLTFSRSKDINFAKKTKVFGDASKKLPKINLNIKVSKTTAFVGGILSSIFAAGIIFVGLPIIQTSMYTKSAMQSLEKMPTTLGQLQSEQGKFEANSAFLNFYKATNSFKRLRWIYSLLNKNQEYNSIIKLMSSATYFSEAMYNTSKAIIPFNNIWDVINPNSEITLTEENFSQALLDTKTASDAIRLASAEFKLVSIDALPKSIREKTELYGSTLETASQKFEEANTYFSEISSLLGVDSTKRYLVLFQNSNEIRPTGGFIGSYAILEIDKGKITSLEINDIYNPDGQLDTRNIAVTPPKPISDFLQENRLYIRNANWDPNFTQSARAIQDLFFRIDGQTFDGVLAMDLEFCRKVLEITGPVFLTSYNEEISSANLEEKAQFYSEFNYEEGISQKKSFLSMLSSKMLEKMFALPREKMPQLLGSIQTSLNGKHLSISIPETSISVMLKEKGWDGDMISYQDGDYLYIVNANLGGTKANYYVKNSYYYKVSSDTRDGLLRGELTLNYVNNAESDAWPGGPYTDYLRIYTQKGTKLTGAILGESDILEEVIVNEGDYTSFELSFTIDPQENTSIVLTYDLPQELSLEKDIREYNLYWQKQAGTEGDTVKFEFVPPMGLKVVDQESTIERVLDTDWNIELTLK